MVMHMPNVIGLMNGLHSLIRYGLSNCGSGFGPSVGWGACKDDGTNNRYSGALDFVSSGNDAEAVIEEIATLLTAGRLSAENRVIVKNAYIAAGGGAAGLQIANELIISTSEFHSTNTPKFSGEPRTKFLAGDGSDIEYKAVIFLQFSGGCDSNNMLVPHSGCSVESSIKDQWNNTVFLDQQYQNMRGNVALTNEDLLQIDATEQPCTKFGVHKDLASLHQLYLDKDLIFFGNTGVLTKPVHRGNYRSETITRLFGHDTMQREGQAVDPYDDFQFTGVLGRMADALNLMSVKTSTISIDQNAEALNGNGYSPPTIVVGRGGVSPFNPLPTSPRTLPQDEMIAHIKNLNTATRADSGYFGETWSSTLLNAVEENVKLVDVLDNSETTETFPWTSLGRSFAKIASLMKAHEARSSNADMFFLSHGSYDHHSNLLWDQGSKFREVSAAIDAFVRELKTHGLWDNVVLVQTSDFSRTGTPNGSDGTDHGWGGNHFMLGGAVKGGQIKGHFVENMTPQGEFSIGGGRVNFIPTTGYDMIWNGVAQWMGIEDDEDLNLVLPNRMNFPDRFTKDDLFGETDTWRQRGRGLSNTPGTKEELFAHEESLSVRVAEKLQRESEEEEMDEGFRKESERKLYDPDYEDAMAIAEEHTYGDSDQEGDHRILFADNYFYAPLACNANIPNCNGDINDLLTGNPSQDLIIPCGECYRVPAGSDIDLSLGGINILGKLSVGDDSNSNQAILIKTGYIYVQGELHIAKRQKISGSTKDDIKFILSGSSDRIFTPADTTKTAMNVGKKPIIVAGGKLDIDVLPLNCKTWTHLYDVETGPSATLSAPTIQMPPAAEVCDAGRAIVDEDFESGSYGGWKGGMGASRKVVDHTDGGSDANDGEALTRRLRGGHGNSASESDSESESGSEAQPRRMLVYAGDEVESSIESHSVDHSVDTDHSSNRKLALTGSYLRISARSRYWQGPRIDLLTLRPCLLPNVSYLFTAKFRLVRSDGEPSNCSKKIGDCLRIATKYTELTGYWGNNVSRKHTTKARMRTAQAVPDGEWFEYSTIFTLDLHETKPGSEYEMIEIDGPEAGVEIHMDDVKFMLPPVESYAQNCENMAPSLENPFAEQSGGHPYPLRSNGVHYADTSRGITLNGEGELSPLVYRTEEDADSPGGVNTYVSITGRFEAWDSLTFDIPTGCTTAATYKATGRFRLRSAEVQDGVFMEVVAWDANGDHFKVNMGYCPPMGGPEFNNTWVTCVGSVAFTQQHADSRRIEWRLHTDGDRYADVDYDDLTFDFESGPVDSIVVEDADHAVRECWGEGAEIMVTTGTLDYDDDQLTTITGVSAHPIHADRTVLSIDADRPITKMPNVAQDGALGIEVALMSRSVVFDTAAEDLAANRYVGAYLMVYNTPDVEQKLIGAEFRNMGQRAVKMRFPIYFHMSSAAQSASIVSKNLIQKSKFRCIVLHGMSNLTVSHNVAYSTYGHCYMLDSGADIDNTFTSNLAARTTGSGYFYIRDRSIRNDNDRYPASFYITNVRNSFVGNVAAGSQRIGFKIDPITPRGEGSKIPGTVTSTDGDKFGEFRGNVAHGIYDAGIQLHAYYNKLENGEAVLKDSTVHSNRKYGIHNSNSYNIAFEGGLISDNRYGINNDRSDSIRFSNVDIVGTSETSGRFDTAHCPSEPTQYGIKTNSYVNYKHKWIPGNKFENVNFSGFNNDECDRSAAYAFHDSHAAQHFDNFGQFNNSVVTDDSPLFNFCKVLDKGIDDIVFNDLTGTLNPAGSGTGLSGVIVTNTSKMIAMLGDKTCTDYSEWCATYCEDSCLRTVKVNTPRDVDNLEFHVTGDLFAGMEAVVEVSREFYWRNGEPNKHENTKHYRESFFAVSLPAGNFTGVFKDKTTGLVVRPAHMEIVYEPAPDCGGVVEGALKLDYPLLSPLDGMFEEGGFCNDLIFNGDAEGDDQYDETGNWTHWGHVETDVFAEAGTGMDGSYSLKSGKRDRDTDGLSTFLKNDCFKYMIGMEVEVEAYFHLELEMNEGQFGDNPYECNPSDTHSYYNVCPSGQIKFMRDENYETKYVQHPMIGRAVHPVNVTGYTKMHTVFTVTQEMAEYDRALFWIAGTKVNRRMFLDNVSMKPFQRPFLSSPILRSAGFGECLNAVLNGGVESETTEHWLPLQSDKVSLVAGESGGYAIKSYSRSRSSYGAMQNLKHSCIQPGMEYEVFAKFKLEKSGNTIVCQIGSSYGSKKCPVINLFTRTAIGDTKYRLSNTISVGTDTEWGTIHGVFEAQAYNGTAQSMYFYFEGADRYIDIVFDDVYIKPWFKHCDNVVTNGDFEIGTSLLWSTHMFSYGNYGVIDIIPGGYNTTTGSSTASGSSLKMSGRSKDYAGFKQELSKECAVAGNYRISANVRLEKDGINQECDHEKYKTGTSCPVATFKATGDYTVERDVAMTVGEHDGDFWYKIEGVFTISALEESLDKNYIIFGWAGANVDIIIDNVEIVSID